MASKMRCLVCKKEIPSLAPKKWPGYWKMVFVDGKSNIKKIMRMCKKCGDHTVEVMEIDGYVQRH